LPLYDNWTWDSVNRLMTIVADDVRGNSEGNPFTLSDIPDAIAAKGWDASYNESTSGNQLEFNFRVVVGDGTIVTWLVDTAKHLIFRSTSVTTGSQNLIERKANANIRFGVLDDATLKITSDGVLIYSLVTATAVAYIRGATSDDGEFCLYSCVLNSSGTQHRIFISPSTKIYNSIIENCWVLGLTVANSSDIFNVLLSECSVATTDAALGYVFNQLEKITAYKNNQVFFFGSQATSVILRNVYARLNTNIVRAVSMASHNYLVNVDSDSWAIQWSGSSTKYIYRQYEFEVTCIDGNGDPVEGVSAVAEYAGAYGAAFTETTGINGEIPTQTVDHGFFKYATGSTEQLKTPLKVTYRKAGYKTVVKYYPLNEKTKDRVVLQKAVDIIFVDGKSALNLSETESDNELYAVM
jgi:hypothetical protein